MGAIVQNLRTPSRYLDLCTFVGWINSVGARDYSGKRNHLIGTFGGVGAIDDDLYGTAHWKASHSLNCPIKALDTNLLDITKAGRSFVIHYAMTMLGGYGSTNFLIGKANDSSLSASGMALGLATSVIPDSKPRVRWRDGTLNNLDAAFVFTPNVEVSLTWVRDGLANTLTLWVNKSKDATLQDIAFTPTPDQTGFFTVGGITHLSSSSAFAAGGTATGKRVRNLQVYLSDDALPPGITDGSLIAWLQDNRNQHLSDAQWGA
jgi:hypothetical protein